MLLLLDIGNTHTHVGLANTHRVLRRMDLATAAWQSGSALRRIKAFVGSNGSKLDDVAMCSVVPVVTRRVNAAMKRWLKRTPRILCARTVQASGIVGIRYPRPQTIGPDRLANAIAARHHFGSPVVVVDFGTAVTFDVVDPRGDYVGGIIAPGLSAMTDYLHEKTALLPRIRIRPVHGAIGKNTEQAMLIGAVHGYRGLVRELIGELRRELNVRRLPVVATGGYAGLIAANLPDLTGVRPELTLEGLRLFCQRPSVQ